MTPAEYATIVVLPTVREFLAAPGDTRLAYTSCILTHHLADYIAVAEREKDNAPIKQRASGACGPAWEVVHDICNGTKHAKRRGSRLHPQDETLIPPFAFNVPSSGWGVNRLSTPGLMVSHLGADMFLDDAVKAVLACLRSLYPKHLDMVDLSFPP